MAVGLHNQQSWTRIAAGGCQKGLNISQFVRGDSIARRLTAMANVTMKTETVALMLVLPTLNSLSSRGSTGRYIAPDNGPTMPAKVTRLRMKRRRAGDKAQYCGAGGDGCFASA